MKKFILPAFMFLALPTVSFALENNIHATEATEEVESTEAVESTEEVEITEEVEMTEAEKYDQRIERKRAYLRTLYRKNYQGRKTVKNLSLRRYDNDIKTWEDTRETIKSTAGIRASTQRTSGGFKNYGEYLKDNLKKRRAQRKAKIRESRRMQEELTETNQTEEVEIDATEETETEVEEDTTTEETE